MASIEAIPIPLPARRLGQRVAAARRAADARRHRPAQRAGARRARAGLRLRGVRVEDIELVIGTHHHHDHVGLAATIKRRSGARIAVLARTADYGERYLDNVAPDRVFSRELMRDHGVPDDCSGRPKRCGTTSAPRPRASSPTCACRTATASAPAVASCASWRGRATARPTRCSSTEAARLAFVGDHLLAKISPNTEIYRTAGASRSTLARRLPATASGAPRDAAASGCFPGHGPAVSSAARARPARARAAPPAVPADHRRPRAGPGDRVRGSAPPVARGDRARAAAARRVGGARAPRSAARGRGRCRARGRRRALALFARACDAH